MADIHVTEAESAVLEALWRSGPLPPRRLIAEVRAARPWGEATIKTLLGRLMQKQLVRSERQDGLLVYRALIERDLFRESEVRALAARLFDGRTGDLAEFAAALD